jgi:hypothetical protein
VKFGRPTYFAYLHFDFNPAFYWIFLALVAVFHPWITIRQVSICRFCRAIWAFTMRPSGGGHRCPLLPAGLMVFRRHGENTPVTLLF